MRNLVSGIGSAIVMVVLIEILYKCTEKLRKISKLLIVSSSIMA